MERIARFVVHRSKVVLGLTGLVSVAAIVSLFWLQLNADVASFIYEGSEAGQDLIELQETYDTGDPVNAVVVLDDGSFADPATLAELARLRDAYAAIDGVDAVVSVVPDVNPVTGQPITPEQIESAPAIAIQQAFAANPVADLLLSPDGDATMLMVQADTEAVEAITAVEAPEGAEVLYSGNPVVFASVLDQLSWFLLIIPPIIIVLLVGVFYLTIGDRRLSAMSLIPAGLGALWTFGLLSVSGREIDIVTVIVPIFIIVMGSADGLHFVTHFQDESAETDPVARVASALRHVGVPMILTTISTAAGFLSLVVTDVRPIQQLGAFTAIGIVFAGIISFFSLPAALSRLHIAPPKRTPVIGPRAVGLLKRGVRTRVPAMILVGVLVAFAAIGIPRLEVDSDQLFFFKDGDPVRVAFETTEDLFGGASPLMGEFVFDPAAGPGQLERLAEVTEEMEALSGVRSVVSVVGFVEALGPEQIEAVIAGEVELPFGTMVSDDGLRFTLLPEAFTTAELQGWLDYVDETPEVRTLTGLPIIWDEIARLVLDAQRTSIVVAFGLVAVMLLVAYRRIRETLASLVPIGLTVATLLGFLAISGIQLNLLTAVASGIVIGVGIDYAIHFVAAIDLARPDGPGYVQRALDRAGPPIVANALGIAVGMTGLWLSPLAIHPQVSLIMWVSMLTAAATALLVIPAFLPREAVAEAPPVELVAADDR